MAMTGTLLADFASFQTATENAIVSLKGLESGGRTAESQLNRMSDSFSGRKIIADATLMAEIFERAGGASAFTEKELARMGATGSEAAAKLRAMGQDVPPGIAKIAAETKSVDTESNALIGTVKGLAGAFLAMFTARSAFNFVKSTVAEASALKDLAQQTHINVEELQFLAGAMSEFGVDAETLGKGLFNLSRRISKGDDSVSDALKQMGMELKDVQGLNGEELFLAIMRGLAKLQGGLRDETATTLFGSRLGMAMGGASKDIEVTLATWKRFNTVMSTDTVDALDQADEAIKRTQKSLSMMAANMLGPLAEGFNYINDAVNQGAGYWDFLKANVLDTVDSMTGMGSGTEHLARLMDGLNQKTVAHTAATQGATRVQREFAPALDDTTGATRRAREETERHTKALEADIAATARRAAENDKQLQLMERDARLAADRAVFDAQEKVALDAKAAAARGWMQAVGESVKVTNAQKAAEAELQVVQSDGLTIIGQTAEEYAAAGEAADASGKVAVNAFAGVTSQVQVTGDAIREYINLMQYSAKVNAVLSQNSLFTSTSQRENIARIGMPSYDEGGPVLRDGPIYAHAGEYVIPKSGGGGGGPVTVNIHVDGSVLSTAAELRDVVSGSLLDLLKSGAVPMPAGG